MTGVDTNVVVRLLTGDDERQYRKAARLFKKERIFIPDTVILETEWVLRYAYGFGRDDICDALAKLLGLANVEVAAADRISLAIDLCRQGLDFADALHLAASQRCKGLATFDTAFIRRARGATRCTVKSP